MGLSTYITALHCKKLKPQLAKVDLAIDWKSIDVFLKKPLRQHKDAVGSPKMLLIQRWHALGDQGMGTALTDHISLCTGSQGF